MAYTDLLSGGFYHLIMTNASFLKKSLQILLKKFTQELEVFRLKEDRGDSSLVCCDSVTTSMPN